MDFGSRKNTIESILVMLLLIVLGVCIFMLVNVASQTYNRILDDKNNFENARIAYSYINVKIRQNDLQNSIKIIDESSLSISHEADEQGLITYIFYEDGVLYECYTDIDTPPSIKFSEKIIEVDNLSFTPYKDKEGVNVLVEFINNDEIDNLNGIITFNTYD